MNYMGMYTGILERNVCNHPQRSITVIKHHDDEWDTNKMYIAVIKEPQRNFNFALVEFVKTQE